MPNFYAKDIIKGESGNKKHPPCISEVLDPAFLPYIENQVGKPCKSMQDYGWRLDQDGNPIIEDCQKVMFANYYYSPESLAIFDSLYTNKYKLQD